MANKKVRKKQEIPENESKTEKFKRVANPRIKKILVSLERVKGMVASSNYDISEEDLNKIISAFEKELTGIKTAFDGRVKKGKEDIKDIL